MAKIKSKKIIRRKNLNFITEFFLIRRGRKDYKNNVLRQDINGQYTSPYITREISCCLFAIQHERELLSAIDLLTQTEICSSKIHIDTETKKISEINNSNEVPISTENPMIFGEDISEDLYNYLQEYENKTNTAVQKKQISEINASIAKARIKEEKNSIRITKEIEITKLRCWQIYENFKTRICAYWTGVLRGDKKQGLIPPLFDVETIMSDVALMINNIGIVEE